MNPQLQADLDYIIKHAEPYLRQLDGKRIFITGATGFFGKWMTMALDRSRFLGFDISYTSLVRRPAKAGNEWRCLINELPMRKQHCTIDYVMHFAYDHESVANNISGMQRIIDFSKNNNVKNILFTSSQAIHMEYAWNDPRKVIAETKRLCETMLVQASGDKLDGSIVRGYSFVGPMMDLDRFAVGNFIKQALAGESVLVRSPNTLRSYLHACDMVIELLRSLVEVRCCELGSTDAVSLVRVARLLTDNVVMGDEENEEDYVRGDCEPTIPLEEALKRTLNYYVLEGLKKT